MDTKIKIHAMWDSFLDTLPSNVVKPTRYDAWHFCNEEEPANRLAQLVVKGIKTATCSLVWSYEAEQEPLPKVGDYSVITNWEGEPLCIIQTTEVIYQPFNEVDADFAYAEGEGDRSYDYWRRVHWEVFTKECETIQQEISEDMPLCCERFRVVYLPPEKDQS